MSSILQHQTLCTLQLYLLQDEVSPLIKEGCSKRIGNQGQAPAKTLIIQYHLHLSTNKQWLADLKVLYILSTFTTNTFHEVHFTEIDHINFAILWSVWFSKMLCKIHWSNMFFTFDVSFFDQNITFFASSVIAMLRTTNLIFFFSKKKNYWYLLPLLSRLRLWLADLIDWLIWLFIKFDWFIK